MGDLGIRLPAPGAAVSMLEDAGEGPEAVILTFLVRLVVSVGNVVRRTEDSIYY